MQISWPKRQFLPEISQLRCNVLFVMNIQWIIIIMAIILFISCYFNCQLCFECTFVDIRIA
jgi:hypothetical protein